MALLPAILDEQGAASDKVAQSRSVGRRTLGSLAGNQIELGYPLSLLQGIDQGATAVELIDYLKDLLLHLPSRRP